MTSQGRPRIPLCHTHPQQCLISLETSLPKRVGMPNYAATRTPPRGRNGDHCPISWPSHNTSDFRLNREQNNSQHSSQYVPATRSTTHPKLFWSDHVCTRGSSYLQTNTHGQSDFLVEHMRRPSGLEFRTATFRHNTHSRPRGQEPHRRSSHLQAGHLP